MLRTGDLTSRHGELNEDFSQEKWWKRETDDSLLTLSSSIVSRQVWGIRSNNVDTVYKIMVKTSKVRGKPRWIFVRGLLRCLAALPEMRPSKRSILVKWAGNIVFLLSSLAWFQAFQSPRWRFLQPRHGPGSPEPSGDRENAKHWQCTG
jgi:hypothetical protein